MGNGIPATERDKQPSYTVATLSGIFDAEAKLRAMKPEEFAQIQQAIITQMRRAPQTLGEEASRLSRISIGVICALTRVINHRSDKIADATKACRLLPPGGGGTTRYGNIVTDCR